MTQTETPRRSACRPWVRFGFATLVSLVWLGAVAWFGVNGYWMRAVAPADAVHDFMRHAESRILTENPGNSALLLIEDGYVVGEYYSRLPDAIDAQTVFPAASMSKWLAAYAMMALVQQERAQLDVPVSEYLSRWQLPTSEYDNGAVTIRRLLSHTAGLGDELGFGEYAPDETVPTLVESLSAPRAARSAPVTIAVTAPPSDAWQYSGGGYLLLELLIEEISGQSFADYVAETVFTPLGMSRATYEYIGDVSNNAGSYDARGLKVPSAIYASKAATGLSVSADDMARFAISMINADLDGGPLSGAALHAMTIPHGRTLGADIWGLGTILYAPADDQHFVFGHDGANDPAINTTARINPVSGDAIVVLITGHPTLATSVGSDWVLWQTGYPDVLAFNTVLRSMILPALLGVILIYAVLLRGGFRRT